MEEQSTRPRSNNILSGGAAGPQTFMLSDWAGQILNSIFDVIMVADGDMKILDANSAIQEIGYTQQDLVGKSILDLTQNKEELGKAFQAVKDDNGIDRQDLRIQVLKKSGELYYADLSIRKIRTTSVEDYLCVFHDVDDRAKARRALEEQKSIVEQALADAERLRKEAEDSKLALEVANEQLARRQALTEAELQKEQGFRIAQQRTGFQKNFAIIMASLVALALLLPYISGFITVSDKLTDHTANLSLLLIQTLGIIAGALFQANRKENEKEN